MQAARSDVPMDVLQSLIEKKTREISRLEEELETARSELNALKNHIHLISNPEISFDWEGFLELVKERSPSLAKALKMADASTFDIGKLRLRAPEFEAEMIRLQIDLVENLLRQFSGITYDVRVYNE